MNDFTAAVRSVCVVSAAIFVTEHLVGGTRLKTQAKLLMKLIFAITLLAPFVRGGYSFELPELSSYGEYDLSGMGEAYSDELMRQTANNISAVLREQIAAVGINCTEIEVEVNISGDNIISINRVIITADDFEAAAEIVKSSIGSETEVVNGNN